MRSGRSAIPQKYVGSYEQLASTLAGTLRGPDGTAIELAQFFRAWVLSVAVRNGDAHRKNFGVAYDDATGWVSLAPTFDIVTTAAYLPNDTLALMLDGTKRWPNAKRLVRLARQCCLLTEKAAREIMAEVIEAVAQVSHDLKDITDLDPRASEIADRMRIAWAQGIASLKV